MKETYVFRVILDSKEDVFRDVEVAATQTLEDFHRGILAAFGIKVGEMASFFASDDDWTQGQEVPLMDMGMSDNSLIMSMYTIEEWVQDYGNRMLYLYDFMNLWTFFCELLTKNIIEDEVVLPKTLYLYGIVPDIAPEKDFGSDDQTRKGIFDDVFEDEESDEEDEFDDDERFNGYQEW